MMRSQRGQAAVETLIASTFLLVPLFLLTPMVGKYVDMAMTTHQAAHYMAFQRTVVADRPVLLATPFDNRRGGAELFERDEWEVGAGAQLRFFSGNNNLILSAQQAPFVNDAVFSNRPLWTDHAGNALVPEAGSVVLPFGFGLGGGNVDVTVSSPLPFPLAQPIDAPALALSVLTFPAIGPLDLGFEFNLNYTYTSEVTLRPLNPIGFAPFDALDLAFYSSATVYGDGWSADRPAYTTEQIERVMPTALISPLTDIIDTADGIRPAFENLEPAINPAALILPDLVAFEPERIVEDDPCEVPPDRVSLPPPTCVPLPFVGP